MKSKFKLVIVFVLSAVAFFSSCKKGEVDDDGLITANSTLTMKVNGQNWESGFASVGALYDNGNYLINMMGLQTDDAEEFGISEGMQINLIIPESAFNNPRGTYPFVWKEDWEEVKAFAFANFTQTDENGDLRHYSTLGLPDDPIMGTVTISDARPGEISLGLPENIKTYNRLVGTFELRLVELIDGEPTDHIINITAGKFDLAPPTAHF